MSFRTSYCTNVYDGNHAIYLRRNSGIPDYNKPYTVMVWVSRLTDTNAYSHIWAICDETVTSASDSQDADWLGTGSDGESLSNSGVAVNSGGGEVGDSFLDIDQAQWWHFAVVRESTTSWKAYINGAQWGSTVTTNVGSRSAVAGEFLGMLGQYGLEAAYADYRHWNLALTPVEIRAEMWSAAPMRDGCRTWTTFSEGLTSRIGTNWIRTVLGDADNGNRAFGPQFPRPEKLDRTRIYSFASLSVQKARPIADLSNSGWSRYPA